MNQMYITKLAQIEERLSHVVNTLDKVAEETNGLSFVKTQVHTHTQELKTLRSQFLQVKGAALLCSALIGLAASFWPRG